MALTLVFHRSGAFTPAFIPVSSLEHWTGQDVHMNLILLYWMVCVLLCISFDLVNRPVFLLCFRMSSTEEEASSPVFGASSSKAHALVTPLGS